MLVRIGELLTFTLSVWHTADLMRRRSVLRRLGSLAAIFKTQSLRALAQAPAFPGDDLKTLETLAAVVLPSELGEPGVKKTANDFVKWVANYRAGAETDHGYGFTRLRTKGPSPVSAYPGQLAKLRAPLASEDTNARRKAVQAVLTEAGITDLPRLPDGKHVAADLMAFYFRSSDANDLCYKAAIGRDSCRGLEGSDQPPKGKA